MSEAMERPLTMPSKHLHKCLDCGERTAYSTIRNGLQWTYCMSCAKERCVERER
ncbi:MAG TPA: hypothetical protein VLH13_01080 [Methanomassiliicoccales archaeon]|nr:hypothetical protein [Methanomassiliicoccales archaeon]